MNFIFTQSKSITTSFKSVRYLLTLILFWGLSSYSSNAQIVNITTTFDEIDGNTSSISALITTPGGTGISLREAILASNNEPAGSVITIQVPGLNHTLNITGSGDNSGITGDLDINHSAPGNKTINIIGLNPSISIITGIIGDRIFDVHAISGAGAFLTFNISNVTIVGGNVTGSGSAILAGRAGDVTNITNCIFLNNTATVNGGVISQSSSTNAHNLTITNSTFINNTASSGVGGAINYNGIGDVSITNCTFTNNSAGTQGGAINISGNGAGPLTTVILRNSFSANTALGGTFGGAVLAVTNAQGVSVNYNRILGNNTAANVTTGKKISSGGGTIGLFNTDNNWWGVNSGPTSSNVDVLGSSTTNWLQLKSSALPTTICSGSTSTVTTSFLSNSENSTILPVNLSAVIGTPVSFSATLGTLSSAEPSIQPSGTATVTYSAGGATGSGTVNAVVDNVPTNDLTARANITIAGLSLTTLASTNVSCNGGNNGTASINPATGGTGPYTYNWTPGNPTGDGTTSVSSLVAGTWRCTATDANGCTGFVDIIITQPPALSLTFLTQNNIACNGGANGTAAVNSATGGTGPYTYNWTPGNPTGDGTTSVSGLTAGTWTCTVTDANGCTQAVNVTITQPTILAVTTASQSNVTCNGGADGAASINTPTGGTAGYTYNWTPGNPTGDGTTSVSGLTAGTWTCTVTDANGCTQAVNFTITQPASSVIVTSSSSTNVTCNGGANGLATVNAATGGTGPYTYNWTPGNPTGDGTTTVSGLTAGIWRCTATDANGCTGFVDITITQPPALSLTLLTQTNVSCNGGANGTAAVNSATGGTGSYTYNWTPGNPTGDGTTSVSGLVAGTWRCTATDANGCTGFVDIIITQPTAISVTGSQTNVSCFGGTNGSASVTPSGGTPSYTYSWAPSGGTSATATGLAAGTYTVTITDANSCTATRPFNITQPSTAVTGTRVITDVACYGGNTGAINLTPSGGTPGYTFNWGGGITTEDRTGLVMGAYSVIITDANGCTGTVNAPVSQPAAITVTAASQTNVACNGGTTGAASINTPTGGTGSYTYNWTPGNPIGDGTTSVSGLTAGIWTCTVTDANLCTAQQTFTITQPTAITVTAASQTNVSCNGGANGTASINTPTGGSGSYTYNWTPGNPTGDGTTSVSGLTAGTWTCTVTDANGCTQAVNVTITQPTILAVTTASQSNVTCNGGADGAASINTPTGGTAGYTYNWTPGNPTGDGTTSVSGLTAGTWTCTVTDANGCTQAVNFTITQPPASPTAIATPSSQTICSGNNISTIALTGTATSYNWTRDNMVNVSGITASGSGDITGSLTNTTNAPITVTFTITPSIGACIGTPITATVLVNPTPNAVATPSSQTICAGPITSIVLSGAVSGTTFNWVRNNTAGVTGIAASGAGNISGNLINTTANPITVTFTITPVANGCSGTPITATVLVNPIPTAVATPANQIVCSGPITTIALTGAVTGTTYSWTRDNTVNVSGIATSGAGNISGTLTNNTLVAQTVTFTITPTANGCTGTPITATVSVQGLPTILCPANLVLNNDAGQCGAVATYASPTTGIPVPTITYVFSGATTGTGTGNGSGSIFNTGLTTVVLTATNACGTTNCSFTVRVNDTEAPIITCPAPVTISCAALVPPVNIATVTAVDNCPGVVVTHVGDVISNQTCANRFTLTRTYRATDVAGNASTCTQVITVNDVTGPVLTCPANINVNTPAGACTAIVNFAPIATDNCGGTVSIVSVPASGSVFAIGTTIVNVTATDACGNTSTCSFNVTVTDGQLPVITAQPTHTTVCLGANATFNVAAITSPNANGPLAYQWQQWNGSAWVDISGATATSYTISNVSLAMNTNTFRVRITGLCTTIFSNAATLFVNPLPTISIDAVATSSLLPGQSANLVATANPSGGNYAWRINGNTINNTTAATYGPLSVDNIGAYSVVYTDPNGCVTTSNSINLTGLASTNVWLYPNPNNGQFQVRFYNQLNEKATIMILNAAAKVIMQKEINTATAYSRTDIDLGNTAAGVYIVKIVTSDGRELSNQRIVVYR